jgi:hypothetical protein
MPAKPSSFFHVVGVMPSLYLSKRSGFANQFRPSHVRCSVSYRTHQNLTRCMGCKTNCLPWSVRICSGLPCNSLMACCLTRSIIILRAVACLLIAADASMYRLCWSSSIDTIHLLLFTILRSIYYHISFGWSFWNNLYFLFTLGCDNGLFSPTCLHSIR